MAILTLKAYLKVKTIPDHFGFEKSPISPPKRSILNLCNSQKFPKISSTMECCGPLIVPDAIIPSYPVFEK
jgi:hypothetical protein